MKKLLNIDFQLNFCHKVNSSNQNKNIKHSRLQIQIMSIKSQSNKPYWNQTSNIFFCPKLSLQGKSALPQIVQPAYTFHRQQPFLTVLKKPINNVYDNFITRKERQRQVKGRQKVQERKQEPVYVLGRVKEVFEKQKQKRQSNTASNKNRNSETIQEYEVTVSRDKMYNQKFALSVPKSVSQKKTAFLPGNLTRDATFLFYIGVGNNSSLVQRVLSNRKNWSQTNSTLFNLRWQQARPKFHNASTTQKQLINHLPNHQQISDKGNLLRNLKIYCEKNDEPLFQILPVCFQFDFDNPDTCQNQLKRFIQYYWEDQQRIRRTNNFVAPKDIFDSSNTSQEKDKQIQFSSPKKAQSNDFSPKKKPKSYQNSDFIIVQLSKSSKKDTTNSTATSSSSKNSYKNNKNARKDMTGSNIFPENNRKKQEIKTLYKNFVSKLKPYYSFQDMSNLKKQPSSITPITSEVYGETSLWLLKPTDLNRGRGIKLFHEAQELADILQSQLSKNEKGSYIIQKYIERPMLIADRKFDIRVWALVSQNRQLFMFKEGYIRTSSQRYSLESSSEFTHLTNNAVQKHSKNYGQFADGNIIPLRKLLKRNSKAGKRDYNDTGFAYIMDQHQLMTKMKNQIQISFASVWEKIFNHPQKLPNTSTIGSFGVGSSNSLTNASSNSQNKSKYFEIFGYDFMVDIKKNVWLIQVNTNPSIEQSSQFLKQIIPRMLDDAFKITVDKIFPIKKQDKNFSNLNIRDEAMYPVQGYADSQNLWEKLDVNKKYQKIVELEEC